MITRHDLFQLIIARLDGERIGEPGYLEHLLGLVERGIGGFILFGGRLDEVKEAIRTLQSRSDLTLFIASDIERGVGQQLKGATGFPPQMGVGAAVDPADSRSLEMLRKMLRVIAEEARYAGINMPLIPVLDVNTNPENPIICTRAFSDDPVRAGSLGREYVKTLGEYGLLPCGKHFPGHGDTERDSHIELPLIRKSIEELESLELIPFRTAIDAGIPALMVGHLAVPALDERPASLSGWMTRYLRERLEFRGLLMPDALTMDALRGYGSTVALSVASGMDLVLHPPDPYTAVEELERGIDDGLINEEGLVESLERIKEVKARLLSESSGAPDFSENRRLAEQLYERSITLVSGNPLAFFSDGRPETCVYAGEVDGEILKGLGLWFERVISLNESGSAEGRLVIAVFSDVRAWRGLSGVEEETVVEIKRLIRRSGKVVLISFGSPYLLGKFREASVRVAAYEASVSAVTATMKALFEGQPLSGRLPVRLG